MIQKRTRKELYDKFRQGAIPSGADFADLIRSHLNLLEDGIDVPDDDDAPICLRARGENENLLDFADADGTRRWRITAIPEDGSEEGLNLTADEKSRLYINRSLGNVGIGTDKPEAKLHIKQVSSQDAFRIDDEGDDKTPFIVTSDGNVGIGIGQGDARPTAKLHINNPGSGDVLRVDDNSQDPTPFVIDESGRVGIGYDTPVTNLTVRGGVSIGENADPGENNLYVAGDIKVGGTVVLGSGPEGGGIEINGPLQSKLSEIVLKDNIKIVADHDQKDANGNYSNDSLGNLSVEGDTILGTDSNNVLQVNGRIESGGDGADAQYELAINNALKVNRDTNDITLDGKLQATAGQINVAADLNLENELSFNNDASGVNSIVTSVSNENDKALPTEGAVKRYIDEHIALFESYYGIARATNGWSYGGSWNGYDAFVDINPPAGFHISQLIHYSASPYRIYFRGDVNKDDTLSCWATIINDANHAQGGYLRCYCGNSEQRAAAYVKYYTLWKKQ